LAAQHCCFSWSWPLHFCGDFAPLSLFQWRSTLADFANQNNSGWRLQEKRNDIFVLFEWGKCLPAKTVRIWAMFPSPGCLESAFHRTVLLPQSLMQDEYTDRVNTSMSLEDDWNLDTTSKVWNKAVFCEY
jgi:hypothetical protein